MTILINASNLRGGGGLQVADSICRELFKYREHQFIVVLPLQLHELGETINGYPNVSAVLEYNLPITIGLILTGRDRILDTVVNDNKVGAVLTIFGPSKWRPKCFHLCGFAMPHIVINDSPYWAKISVVAKGKSAIRNFLMVRDFRRNADIIWTENEYISERVRQKFPKKKVITVTNNYNQIFDRESEWDRSINLPPFHGVTLLTITAYYPHKNLRIAVGALKILKASNPDLKVRFVFTITENQYGEIPDALRDSFVFLGPVKINQCPPLYLQADIMFQPSLLECFSATYAEAMKMDVPILTTDLGFARSLCSDAAYYYSAIDANALATAIVNVSKDKNLRRRLIYNGKRQLGKFDSYESRAYKLIKHLINK